MYHLNEEKTKIEDFHFYTFPQKNKMIQSCYTYKEKCRYMFLYLNELEKKIIFDSSRLLEGE